jgi:hypothetical protein
METSPLPPFPSDADLRRLIHFSAGDGRIWLAGQRMLLVHAAALGSLRRELMDTIGREQTRRVLMRAGYAAGESDAALARKVRPKASLFEAFVVGPQLHMLEGAVGHAQTIRARSGRIPLPGHLSLGPLVGG